MIVWKYFGNTTERCCKIQFPWFCPIPWHGNAVRGKEILQKCSGNKTNELCSHSFDIKYFQISDHSRVKFRSEQIQNYSYQVYQDYFKTGHTVTKGPPTYSVGVPGACAGGHDLKYRLDRQPGEKPDASCLRTHIGKGK